MVTNSHPNPASCISSCFSLGSPNFSRLYLKCGLFVCFSSTKQVALETGSDLVWVQCEPCIDCFTDLDPIFSSADSSSYSNISCTAPSCQELPRSSHNCSSTQTCAYNLEYANTFTVEGNLAYENFTFTSSSTGSTSVFAIAFGCADNYVLGNEKPAFLDATDGMLGMNRGPLSLVSQLGINVFSYCLVDYAAGNKTSSLLLGSAGNFPVTYTRLYQNPFRPQVYYLNLTGISVDGQAVDFPPGKVASWPPFAVFGKFILCTSWLTLLIQQLSDEHSPEFPWKNWRWFWTPSLRSILASRGSQKSRIVQIIASMVGAYYGWIIIDGSVALKFTWKWSSTSLFVLTLLTSP